MSGYNPSIFLVGPKMKVAFVMTCVLLDFCLLSAVKRWLFPSPERFATAIRESFVPWWLSGLFGELDPYSRSIYWKEKFALGLLLMAVTGIIWLEAKLYAKFF
jgi:hypothetical protein